MMKKSILIGVGILILLVVGFLIYSNYFLKPSGPSIPCFHLPEYVNEFENYYENVEINQDSCYLGFSFETPVSYSNFGVRYQVKTKDIIGADTIQEYDNRIRGRISKVESCSNFERYLELSGLSIIPINYLLESYPRFDSCKNMTGILEMMENQKIIRDFLISREKFGDYNNCEWEESGSGNTQALSYSYGKKYGKISFYAICDGVKESMRLFIENDTVIEAYFQNSESELYRQIYPEDILLRERNPAWE